MIQIKNLNKSFGGKIILKDIDIEVNRGEFISILGPSGSGKSTLLNIISGYEKDYEGYVKNDFNKIGFMFQEGGLFPWLNVLDNVKLALFERKISEVEKESICNKYLNMVGLENFKNANISELSGGMKQRVSLSRALAYDSELLILDEPFSALDSQTRNLILVQIQNIWQKTKKTFLFVTHNVLEAVTLSDRIILLSSNPGEIKKEYKVELTRPRTITNKEITDYVIEIQNDLKEEVDEIARKEYDKEFNIKENDILYNPSDDMEYFL